MQLLIIRHAIAEDRDQFAATGKPDDERPLTKRGERRMRRNAQGLHRIVSRIAVVATSPLVRAHQTALIVGEEFGIADVVSLEALGPGRHPRELIEWLGRPSPDGAVAVVGHAPHLEMLAAWCISGVPEPAVTLKKGGAAMIGFDGEPAAGSGRLAWLLTLAQLRALAT